MRQIDIKWYILYNIWNGEWPKHGLILKLTAYWNWLYQIANRGKHIQSCMCVRAAETAIELARWKHVCPIALEWKWLYKVDAILVYKYKCWSRCVDDSGKTSEVCVWWTFATKMLAAHCTVSTIYYCSFRRSIDQRIRIDWFSSIFVSFSSFHSV